MFDLQGYGELLMRGTAVAIRLFGASLVIGLIFGLIGAACKTSKFAVLRYMANFYTTVVRGIPELLFIFFVFYGGEIILRLVLQQFGYHKYVGVSQFWAGVTALSIMFGAYATEVFRMALSEIPKGQAEAAQAIGLRPVQTFFRIILPQVWMVALPGLGNLSLVLLKDTALVSVIGLKDLMYYSARAAQSTQQAFTFYLAAACIYLGLTILIMGVIALLEYASNPAARYAKRLNKKTEVSV